MDGEIGTAAGQFRLDATESSSKIGQHGLLGNLTVGSVSIASSSQQRAQPNKSSPETTLSFPSPHALKSSSILCALKVVVSAMIPGNRGFMLLQCSVSRVAIRRDGKGRSNADGSLCLDTAVHGRLDSTCAARGPVSGPAFRVAGGSSRSCLRDFNILSALHLAAMTSVAMARLRNWASLMLSMAVAFATILELSY